MDNFWSWDLAPFNYSAQCTLQTLLLFFFFCSGECTVDAACCSIVFVPNINVYPVSAGHILLTGPGVRTTTGPTEATTGTTTPAGGNSG